MENEVEEAKDEQPDQSHSGIPAIGIIVLIVVAVVGVGALIMKTQSTPPQPVHEVRFMNIDRCQYIVTENPFTLTHKGDCTNILHQGIIP